MTAAPKRLVSVAVPVAVDRGFTYSLPDGLDASPGQRVLVPFGNRALIGVVRPREAEAPAGAIKAIWSVLDPQGAPALGPDVLELCEWIADYYVAPIGEAYRLALPGLLSNADARTARLSEKGSAVLGDLRAQLELDVPDRKLLEAIAATGSKGLHASKVTAIRPRITGGLARLEALSRAGYVEIEVEDGEPKARTETHYRRTDFLLGAAADEASLAKVVGRSKLRRGLLDYLEGQRGSQSDGWVAIGELRGAFPRVRSLIKPLVAAKLVLEDERLRDLDPFTSAKLEPTTAMEPTKEQQVALDRLLADLEGGEFGSHLLWGVTGSGKTEVYLQVIARALDRGEGAIVLVPEIALTPQLSDRFRARFGERVAVLHSGLTPRQRLDAWHHIRIGRKDIVIGARSALFAPVENLKVIVVDEEHDGSFKQEEGVRYSARDMALVRGAKRSAQVILGSATPSLESFARAGEGRHGLLRMTTRPTARPLPAVELVDLAVHRPNQETLLTAKLLEALEQTVEAGEQAILFLNRRGYTTTMLCTSCSSLQACPDCSAPSMTYHLDRNRLVCHLCGRIEGAPAVCRACGKETLVHGGVGTEKVEVALAGALPKARILRLDRDSSRGRRLLETLERFRSRQADVLVGTQMLSKGHDFPDVTLVGVLSADHGLGLPDPRAAERTFQLLTQVAGRAGRGERPGRVLIQAYATEHPAIASAAAHDFAAFARTELEQRKELGNPPFGHLALVRVSGPDREAVMERTHSLALWLREGVAKVVEGGASPGSVRLLGPAAAAFERINRRTRWQILIRSADRSPLRFLLRGLRSHLGPVGSGGRQTTAIVDVDPLSML